MKQFRCIPLENGLCVTCYDASRPYFGEYYLAKVVLTITATAEGSAPASPLAEYSHGYHRTFERMGVREAELARVTGELADGFLQSALPYLSSPNFPARLQTWNDSGASRQRVLFR